MFTESGSGVTTVSDISCILAPDVKANVEEPEYGFYLFFRKKNKKMACVALMAPSFSSPGAGPGEDIRHHDYQFLCIMQYFNGGYCC